MAKKRKVGSTPETGQELVQEQVREEQIEPQEKQVQEEQIEPQEVQHIEEINEELEETNEIEEETKDEDFYSIEQEQDVNEQPQTMGENEKEIEEKKDLQEEPQTVVASNGGHQKSSSEIEKLVEEEQESVEKLIEPFSKKQLVVLLKEAVSKYPEFIESVQKLADAGPAHRKIFVYGLGWDTNAETLTSEFSKYGEVEDCKAVTDKVSGKSKGYGFILFKDRSGAQKALKEPQKKIGNRMTSCQLASAGPVPTTPPPAAPLASEYTQRKIFVSNVASDIEPGRLVEFFSKFGEIEDGPLGLDKQTGKPKGFALFVYKTIESAKRALEEPHKSFEGHTLHCQRAVDGPKPNKTPYHQHHQQHRGYHYQKKTKYSSGGSGGGHLMAPSGPTIGFNPAVAPTGALTPSLGQALTALLATQGAGLGINNLLGGLGAPVNQGIPPVMNNAGYGNQGGNGSGGYGSQPGMQGGYLNQQMSQGSNRPQQGGGPYMGRGH